MSLLDLDSLKDFAQRSADRRRAEIGKAREIINDEISRYRAERSAREVAPIVTALRTKAQRIREAELDRFSGRLAGLDPATRDAVEALADGIVNKLLHEPTIRLKASAGSAAGDAYAEALLALFDLTETE